MERVCSVGERLKIVEVAELSGPHTSLEIRKIAPCRDYMMGKLAINKSRSNWEPMCGQSACSCPRIPQPVPPPPRSSKGYYVEYTERQVIAQLPVGVP
eukprot:scaffold104970_cov32-Tisochrysis_lutea.AAC.2